jgi:hypothetical protein
MKRWFRSCLGVCLGAVLPALWLGCPGGGTVGDNPDAGPMACTENWVCTPFTTAGGGSNQGTRLCADKNQCGTTLLKPAESAALPALDLNFFKCQVEPVLDQKCSQLGCHGTETDRALRIYARGRLRNAAETFVETGCLAAGKMVPAAQCIGSIECICWTGPHSPTEWQRNFDSARSFALNANLQRIAAGMEDSSDLLAQPVIGGKAHAGTHVFRSTDPDYLTIKQWLAGMTQATCTTTN